MDFMLLPFRRYADFSGRSRRKEFWMYQLFLMIAFLALFFLAGGLASVTDGSTDMLGGTFIIIIVIAAFATIIPSLAVTVRRLHDQDKSGWWWLIQFIPFGGLVLLYFMFVEGTHGENQYGPDPKGGIDPDTFR